MPPKPNNKPAPQFDATDIEAATAALLHAWEALDVQLLAITKAERTTLEQARQIGEWLSALKPTLPGKYEAYIENTLHKSTAQAAKYVRIAANWELVKDAAGINAADNLIAEKGDGESKGTGTSKRGGTEIRLSGQERKALAARLEQVKPTDPDTFLAVVQELGVSGKRFAEWLKRQPAPAA